MEFTLTYRGSLKSNGDARHKHSIRRRYHEQLKNLWRGEPLKHLRVRWENAPDPDEKVDGEEIDLPSYGWLTRDRGGHRFVPLITGADRCLAELDVSLLRPCQAGGVIATGGDIDNRLKTLFDTLSMPTIEQIERAPPDSDESPFFCLLEDDSLISSIRVSTAQLLDETRSDSEVLCLVRVKTRVISPNRGNALLA